MELTERRGDPPETSRPTPDGARPHQQMSQNAPIELQEKLFARGRELPGVRVGDSKVSVPGARAFFLNEDVARGPADAFQVDREFAHLHPPHDGSLHMTLPPDVYRAVVDNGWGEPHPISGTMMVWGPRDDDELEVVWGLLRASYGYAIGEDAG